jgi:hypothetical protein
MPNIIREKVRWDSDSYYKGIVVIHASDSDEVEEDLHFRCSCEHDCCGHVSRKVSNIRKLSDGTFAARVYGWKNI